MTSPFLVHRSPEGLASPPDRHEAFIIPGVTHATPSAARRFAWESLGLTAPIRRCCSIRRCWSGAFDPDRSSAGVRGAIHPAVSRTPSTAFPTPGY